MGIERKVISGYGFELTPEIRSKIECGGELLGEDNIPFDDDDYKELGLTLAQTGDYDCPGAEWLMVPIETGDNWSQIDTDIFFFIEKLGKYGVNVNKGDMVFISEMYEW